MFKELVISKQRLYHQRTVGVKNWTEFGISLTKIVDGNLDSSSKPTKYFEQQTLSKYHRMFTFTNLILFLYKQRKADSQTSSMTTEPALLAEMLMKF